MIKYLHRILATVDDFLAPALCMNCRADAAIEDHYGNFLCEACHEVIRPFNEKTPRCKICGGPNTGALETCAECASTLHPWARGVSVFPYHGACGDLIRRFKYGGCTELATFFGAVLAETWKKYGVPMRPQMIVPIPLHWKRLVARGYNQSELIARQLGRHLNLPVVSALRRNSSTAHQARLDASERLKNLHGVFEVTHPEDVRNKRILLLDDVFTTGATLTAASQVLIKAGCPEVSVVTVARA